METKTRVPSGFARNETLMTLKEVAVLLRAHPNSVRRWVDEGFLKSYRLGPRGDRRFRRQDLFEFLGS